MTGFESLSWVKKMIMQSYELLEFGNYYHIYNHGVGGRDLFKKTDNYEYFLDLYEKYISPIAETYAWVLMHNHFHLLVRIKEEDSCFIPGALTSPVFQLNQPGCTARQ